MTTDNIQCMAKNIEKSLIKAIHESLKKQPELTFIFLLVLILNTKLFVNGTPSEGLIFHGFKKDLQGLIPLITHGFVHVSLYHLFIDGLGFFMVYSGLSEKTITRRLIFVFISFAGALIAATFSPMTRINGFCGLSGAAHGLMAVTAMEMIEDKDLRKTGIILILILVLKTSFEVTTGSLPFSWLHLGNLGKPILVSHLGGMITGLTAFIVIKGSKILFNRSGLR